VGPKGVRHGLCLLPASRALVPRPPRATGVAGPPRRRSGQGAAAGRASTHERAATLDGGGGEVAARLAGKWLGGGGLRGVVVPPSPQRRRRVEVVPRPQPPVGRCDTISLGNRAAGKESSHARARVDLGAGLDRRAGCGADRRAAGGPAPLSPTDLADHGRCSGSASAACGRCNRRHRATVQRRPARQARRCRRGLGQWASATASSSLTSRPWAGAWRTRVAVASWSPSRAGAATASRSRYPAGAGPDGSGGSVGGPSPSPSASGGGSMARCSLRPLRASWPACDASTQVEHRVGPRRAASSGRGPPWHALAPGSRR
jgi:hypothetical protein